MLIIGFTCPPIIHFQFITKCDGLLLQSAKEQRSLFLVDSVDGSRCAAICGTSTSSQLGFFYTNSVHLLFAAGPFDVLGWRQERFWVWST